MGKNGFLSFFAEIISSQCVTFLLDLQQPSPMESCTSWSQSSSLDSQKGEGLGVTVSAPKEKPVRAGCLAEGRKREGYGGMKCKYFATKRRRKLFSPISSPQKLPLAVSFNALKCTVWLEIH